MTFVTGGLTTNPFDVLHPKFNCVTPRWTSWDQQSFVAAVTEWKLTTRLKYYTFFILIYNNLLMKEARRCQSRLCTCTSVSKHTMEMKTPDVQMTKTGRVFCRPTLLGNFTSSFATRNGKYFSTVAFRIPFRLICWSLQNETYILYKLLFQNHQFNTALLKKNSGHLSI